MDMKHTLKLIMLMFAMSYGVSPVVADGEINFRGILIEPPPCTINDGNRIDVDFGSQLNLEKIDGVNYMKILNYRITCNLSFSRSNLVNLSLIGKTSPFDIGALDTNKENLGVQMYFDDFPFIPDSAFAIDVLSPPILRAVPIRNTNAHIDEGSFETWATLRLEYQ